MLRGHLNRRAFHGDRSQGATPGSLRCEFGIHGADRGTQKAGGPAGELGAILDAEAAQQR